MKRIVQKVAVLGSGVMGSGIAAHFANAGIQVLLLDIVPPGLSEEEKKSKAARNRFSMGSLEKALKQKPAPFVHKNRARLIEVGNFEDDFGRLATCDWIIEVVKEDLAIKRALFEKVDAVRKSGSIVSSNTSGLSLAQMSEGRSEDFQKHFLITHFFNPVRYMRLLEVVQGPKSAPEVVKFVQTFSEQRLGKGIVYAKDTPNFIANRIGVFSMMFTMHEMVKQGLSIDEVDAIVGPPLGRPKSAAFRTADMVGLDTLMHVANHCHQALVNDSERDTFKVPAFALKLVESGKLGDKTGGGFYQKSKEGILTLDHKSGSYQPKQKVRIDSLGVAKNADDARQSLKIVVNATDKAGQFAWPVVASSLIYAAKLLGEIADDIRNIDLGMKWGFNWQLGPFETFDALGVAETVARMKQSGMNPPAWVDEMLALGNATFYKNEGGKDFYYSPQKRGYAPFPDEPKAMRYEAIKATQSNIVKRNFGATLVNLGDDILGLEFHTKMNTIDADVIGMLNEAIEEAEANYRGLVIANDGENFSVGANLMLVYAAAQNKEWEEIRTMVRGFQQAAMRMRYSDIPVIAAPFNMVLGGGCEVVMSADAVHAHSELYLGLVEMGVGLIPAGSGSKELLFRTLERIPEGLEVDLLPWTARVFETIAMAKVSTSAEEAKALGYLRESDSIAMNRDYLLYEAKQLALGLANGGYSRPAPRQAKVAGRAGFASLKALIYNMHESGKASEHDAKIATHLANILCGGNVTVGTLVSEQALLELEEEAFISLCGEEKSQARMQSILLTNKPLRN